MTDGGSLGYSVQGINWVVTAKGENEKVFLLWAQMAYSVLWDAIIMKQIALQQQLGHTEG